VIRRPRTGRGTSRAVRSPLRWAGLALVVLAVATATNGFAQSTKSAEHQAPKSPASVSRVVLAINEGAAGNADFADILFRYEEFAEFVGKTLGAPVAIVGARNRDRLQESLKNRAYTLLLARPNDVPAQAVRDFGYQPVGSAKDPYQTLFIVAKNSPLKLITDVRGKSIATPDQYSNMWRAARAMLRDNHIDMAKENVKSMRDQAAIGWAVENGMFDVGIVNSASGVARNWEKTGGRVIAKSRDQINMPFIASPDLSPAHVAKLRSALLGLGASDGGRAILQKIGLPAGFRETPREEFIEFLNWLGELDPKQV
jgi:ABC-type phosphate/phosphonate transport system substrate-binding protein